jgi:glucosylceramidase
MPKKESNKKSIRVIMTARDTDDRLTEKQEINFESDTAEVEFQLVKVYEDVLYQKIKGFGGAFTEAGSVTLDKLSKDKRDEIINAYFNSKTGLGYNFCRTHINSCDFSTGNYSYAEEENDIKLHSFTLERDEKSLIPFIKDAISAKGEEFILLASPWSPPAWMKTNGKMNEGGKLKQEYMKTWAQYYVKYIKEYAKRGINIW